MYEIQRNWLNVLKITRHHLIFYTYINKYIFYFVYHKLLQANTCYAQIYHWRTRGKLVLRHAHLAYSAMVFSS